MIRKALPFVLLVVFVLGPVAVLGVAGIVLLRHERERWDAQTAEGLLREAELITEDIREGLDALRAELAETLLTLPPGDAAPGLRELRDQHPLVRNVFYLDAGNNRVLPPQGLRLDPETERFLTRHAALFEGRAPWTPPGLGRDQPLMLPPQQAARRTVIDTLGRGRHAYDLPKKLQEPPAPVVSWRPWHWEDGDALLVYFQDEVTGSILGLELEMHALYARLDVLLRLSEAPGQPLALLDRANRPLVATGEMPDASPVTVEVGPLLPFARLALFPRPQAPPLSGNLVHAAAIAFGFLLLLSISGAAFGLAAWLNRSRREALQKTTFVSNVSHEFKTPLTTLRLYADLLLEQRVRDPEKQAAYLRTMRDESDRLARLVHNILDFSRLEMKRKPLSPADFDLTRVLGKVTGAMAERFAAAGMEITLPAPPLPVRADPDATEQIILNLCENALKHAADGKRLDITAEHGPGILRLRFQDRGPGIPRAQRKHLFKPFHLADNRLTRENGGTGLGLHIARRLARESGGDLILGDSPAGACFVWSLPTPGHTP